MPQNRLREYAKRLSKAEQDDLRPKIPIERKRLRAIDENRNTTRERTFASGRKASA